MEFDVGDTVCFLDFDESSQGVVVEMDNLGDGFVCINWGGTASSVHCKSNLINLTKQLIN